MIVRMSKITIMGPKELLLEVLTLVRGLGVLHIDPDIGTVADATVEPYIKSHLLDSSTLSKRLFYDDLLQKIDVLSAYLPQIPARVPYLSPQAAVNSLAQLVERHTALCGELFQRRAALQHEIDQLTGYADFLSAIAPLLPPGETMPDVDHIGVEIKQPAALLNLQRLIHQQTNGRFEMRTAKTPAGGLIGLITTERQLAGRVRQCFQDQHVAEHTPPSVLTKLPIAQQMKTVGKLLADRRAEHAALDRQLQTFAGRWLGIYRKVRQWLTERLSLIQTTASIYETAMCFFILGWLPATDLRRLREELAATFGGKVTVEEKEILEHELKRVPTVLKNPPYFQPFELFARLLPMPGYASFDMTPFIGIFFPIFFGMMLGDIGYGAILLLVSVLLIKTCRHRKNVRDGAKILFFSSCYTIFFGWLFGECFGTVGGEFLGLKPICFDRRASIMPMLYFALAAGVVHIVIGLILGFLSALKKKQRREALFKLFSILFVLGLAMVVASFQAPSFAVMKKPLLVSLAIFMPVLLVTGGLMAPLELLKHFGNIISYARIMAIGLTSVLLAYVANQMAGMTGSLWVGIFVAILLHAFNILLGIFAPTIHALRLHYVEFFSKFMEPGGREFKPLSKE